MEHDQEALEKLASLEAKLSALEAEQEKQSKYKRIMFWVMLLLFFLPAIGLVFAVPMMMKSYSAVLSF